MKSFLFVGEGGTEEIFVFLATICHLVTVFPRLFLKSISKTLFDNCFVPLVL